MSGKHRATAVGDFVIVSTDAQQYVMRVTTAHADGSADGIRQNRRMHQREAFSDFMPEGRTVPCYAASKHIIERVELGYRR